MASAFAGATVELALRGAGGCKMYGGSGWPPPSAATFALELLAACAWESVVEYAFHRVMHLRPFYAACHRHHHVYRAPRPFDDMMIHPVEAALYYCILYSPPFVFRMHGVSFAGYMVVMGACGVLDHCGARIALPGALAWLYDASDHDRHHELVSVNFGFPTMVIDRLLGTYVGSLSPSLAAHGDNEAPLGAKRATAPPAAAEAAAPAPRRRRSTSVGRGHRRR
jgi:sterol desaturase/sphingolipid hydroxylase (fatty acid hydroxylase superfamily)